MRTARDTVLNRIEGTTAAWSPEDLLMKGVNTWAFGAIASIARADIWMRISAGSFVRALPQVAMSKECGYILQTEIGGIEDLGDLLPLRTVG